MGGVRARPIWAPPRFSAKWDGRWRTGRATVIDGAYLRGHAPGRHLDSRATGLGACAVNYTRGSIEPVRPRVTFDATFVQTERRERLSLSKTNVDSPSGREFLFSRGGRTRALNVANFILEYVGVNREIDREMGSLKKRPIRRLTPFHLGQSPVATLATRALRLSFFPLR